jgi:hypothetical protein
MVSLSTVYGLTIVLGTLAAIGSAFVGTKVYPVQTGGTLEMALAPAAAILPTVTAALKSATPKEELKTEVEAPVETAEESNIEEQKDKITFKDLLDGEKMRLYNPDKDEHDKVVYVEESPDDFFKQQLDFYNSLSNEDKAVLKSYTRYGDYIINSVYRGKYDNAKLLDMISKMKTENNDDINSLFGMEIDQITSENVVDVSKIYSNKFKSIFDKVPVVAKEFKVFRGTQTPTPKFGGFISTTYDPLSGGLYDNFTGKSCCVYELTVLSGVKALLLTPISYFATEQEILISSDTKVNISGETTKEVWKILTSITPLEKKKMTVYEGTIEPQEEPLPTESVGGKKVPSWFKRKHWAK